MSPSYIRWAAKLPSACLAQASSWMRPIWLGWLFLVGLGLPSRLEAASDVASESVPRVHLLVTGEPEAGQVLTFFLHPYERRYHYHLYFGDGTKQMALARNRHLYQSPGDYRLRVVVMNGPDTLANQSFSLHIRPAVAVTAPRPVEQERPTPAGIMPREDDTEPTKEVRIFDHGAWREEEAMDESGVQPLMVAEEMPAFPGGMSALQRFLNRHVSYPDEARASLVEGKVVVQFVVGASGHLGDIQFIREIGYGLEEAVLHALALMPNWIPGRQDGEAVPVYYVLPVTFRLEN